MHNMISIIANPFYFISPNISFIFFRSFVACTTSNRKLPHRDESAVVKDTTRRWPALSFSNDPKFHYVVEGGICFLCMSDEHNKHRIPFAFLQEVKDLFNSKYGMEVPQRAIAFSLNEEFSKVIQDRMDYYNNAGNNVDGLSAVKNQIEDVKNVMVENIEKVLERGEKIELLVDKTDRLNQQAFQFVSNSKKLRTAMWWKNARWAAFLTVAGAFLV